MNPEVNKVLDKFSKETSSKTELNSMLIELAMTTKQLFKEVQDNYKNTSEMKGTVYKLAASLQRYMHEELLGSSTTLEMLEPTVKQKLNSLNKAKRVMEEADLDTSEIEDQVGQLDKAMFLIKEGSRMGEKVYNDVINKLKI